MAESQNDGHFEVLSSSEFLDDAFTEIVEEGQQRPKMMSNASSSRGSIGSTYEQQDDGERNNVKHHLFA